MENFKSVEVKIDQAVLDKMGGKIVITLDKNGKPCFSPAVDISSKYGTNSSLYGMIMKDGYVFNPYLHRRWLPAQYMRMLEEAKENNMNVDPVIRKLGLDYSIKVVRDEIARLDKLERSDYETFNERSKFYTLESCKAILTDYFNQVLVYCANIPMSKYGLEFYNKDNRKSFKIHLFKKHTVINIIEFNKINNINPTETVTTTKKKYEASELVTEAANAIEEIKAAPNYYFLSKILEKYGYFKKVPGEVSKTFVECYKKSGAYYTLAELITFNGCQFEKFRNPVEAMNYLKKELKKGTEAYKFHAMLKECIKQNNFNLNNIFDGWKM